MGQMTFDATAPQRLSRFELRRVLGQGAQASVWLAFDPHLEREVAVKIMRRNGISAAGDDTQWLHEAGLPVHLLLKPVKAYRAVGCDQCHKGFSGRTGIFQVMPVSDVIAELILQEASASDIAAQARREGVLTLRQSGIRHVLEGITSLEEVLAATSE